MDSVRFARRALATLAAIMAALAVTVFAADPALASGTSYARLTGQGNNNWARIVYHNASMHETGKKVLGVACNECDTRGWGDIVATNGNQVTLYSNSNGGSYSSYTFYFPITKFRYCITNYHCTRWVYNDNEDVRQP